MSFLGRRYFKLPILSCPRIPPVTQANKMVTISLQILGIQFFKKNSAIFSKQETMRYQTGKFGNCAGKISKI